MLTCWSTIIMRKQNLSSILRASTTGTTVGASCIKMNEWMNVWIHSAWRNWTSHFIGTKTSVLNAVASQSTSNFCVYYDSLSRYACYTHPITFICLEHMIEVWHICLSGVELGNIDKNCLPRKKMPLDKFKHVPHVEHHDSYWFPHCPRYAFIKFQHAHGILKDVVPGRSGRWGGESLQETLRSCQPISVAIVFCTFWSF